METYGLLGELDREHFFAKMKPALRDIAAHDPDPATCRTAGRTHWTTGAGA